MSEKTGIQWTDSTWNPTRGCSRVSEGCRNCYAERIAARFSAPGLADPASGVHPFMGFAEMKNGEPRWTGRVELVPEKLDEPLHWKKPRRIFVNSMSDLFHEKLPFEEIDRVFSIMARSYWHTFQILTKRPERMRAYASDRAKKVRAFAWQLNDRWPGWPLPNVWLGVSVEDQATADERIPLLLQTPAAVRFVSYEPAIGPVNIQDWLTPVFGDDRDRHVRNIHWVIVGGESGPSARPMDLAWARAIVEQCAAARVACFVKQLGGKSDKRGDLAEFPATLRVREFPRAIGEAQPDPDAYPLSRGD